MKCLHQIYTRSLFLSMLLLSVITASAADYGDLPKNLVPPAGWADDKWKDPGNWKVIDVTKHGLKPNDQSINATAKVSQIIGSGSGYRILYFPAGKYWFTTNLTIKTSGIRLKGAGADKTKFYQKNVDFTFKNTSSRIIRLNDPAPERGATKLFSSDASTLNKGDFILPIAQFPFGGQKDAYRKKMANIGIGQIVRVAGINGNEVRFDDALGLNYKPWPKRRIRVLKMLKDVGIEDLHIEKLTNDDKRTLFFHQVQNGFVRNCRLYYTSKQAIEIKYCYRFFTDSNNIQQSHDKGAGGHGYGIRYMDNSTRCYATNNKLQQLRHGIVMQTGANHCVIAYNHAESNLLLHGNYAHNNLFEGNDAGAGINFDSVHGPNGPYNFVYRNRSIHASKGIGKLKGANPNIVIGNVTNNFEVESTDFVAANRISGNVKWGSLNSGSTIPGSLYLSSVPSFLKNVGLPAFGPNTDSSWGLNRKIPAKLRSITDVPDRDEAEPPAPKPEPENQAPISSITSPQNGAKIFSNEPFTVTVNAKDNDGQVQKVDLFINGSYHGTDTTASYSFEVNSLSAGNYTLFTRVHDNDGAQTQSAKVNISVEDSIPTDPGNEELKLTFTSPQDGAVLSEGSDLYVKVLASDSDEAIKNMKLYLNGVLVRRESQAPYEWGKASQSDAVLANLASGEYQLEVLAETSNGESVSQTISIKVQSEGKPVSVPSDVYSASAFISSNNINKNGQVKANSWLGYSVDFGSGNNTIKFKASSGRDGGTIECRLGSQDGKVIGRTYVPPTGGWSNFIDINCYVGDLPGSGKIFFTFDGGLKTLLDIEEFSFVSSNLIEKSEAEDAVLSEAKAESSLSGFSGSGYAVFIANSFAGWSPIISKAGKYTLTFDYSLLAENTELDLLVNDKFIPSSLLFTEEKSWGSFSVDVELKAGENTIILSNGSTTTIEIDLMTIRK